MPYRLSLCALLLLPTVALADADGPDAWRIIDVASDDVLNVRVGPGTEFFAVTELPHDARGLQVETCVPTATRDQFFSFTSAQREAYSAYAPWCVVTLDGEQLGWVSRRFLGEDVDE